MSNFLGIPAILEPHVSENARKILAGVQDIIENECLPNEMAFEAKRDVPDRWAKYPEDIERYKGLAKSRGLWNLFIPKEFPESPGLSNLEYALMGEQMGRCGGQLGAETFNCAAPDSGNMELLIRYGNAEQKAQFLKPLMEGKIRSAFCMTEKGVSSSDATNIQISMKLVGDEYVINGTKWWASGAGDPRTEVLFVMGKTQPEASKYRQQSVVIVPKRTKGVTVVRPMRVLGDDDAPHGHMEIRFDNVRVPKANVLWEDGRGFEIIQGRLGPGRIHHCMRLVGGVAQCLQLAIDRSKRRKTFGKYLIEHGQIQTWLAEARVELEACRLLVLSAAHEMDTYGNKKALQKIAFAKIYVPKTCKKIIDNCMQIFGAEGISQDTPLVHHYMRARTLQIADGPDEVHMLQLARSLSKL